MSYELERAKAEKLKRTGLPIGEAKKTTESDVARAKQVHIDKTYKSGLNKNAD